jgi:hypothetical protein
MRTSLLLVAAIGCSTKQATPPPPTPPTPPVPAATPCPSCTCEAIPASAGWHASIDDTRRVLSAHAGAILASCKEELGGAMSPAELQGSIEHCLAQTGTGDLRISYCKGQDEADACCSMRVTSREVSARKFLTIRYLDIADYTAAVYELAGTQPALLCDWVPYMAAACSGKPNAAPATGCASLDAAWQTLPEAVRDYLCSAGG